MRHGLTEPAGRQEPGVREALLAAEEAIENCHHYRSHYHHDALAKVRAALVNVETAPSPGELSDEQIDEALFDELGWGSVNGNEGWHVDGAWFLKSELRIAIRSILSLSSQPEGWKLVPIEPTRAMLRAVDDMADDKWTARGRAYDAWDRMLAAAPNPGESRPSKADGSGFTSMEYGGGPFNSRGEEGPEPIPRGMMRCCACRKDRPSSWAAGTGNVANPPQGPTCECGCSQFEMTVTSDPASHPVDRQALANVLCKTFLDHGPLYTNTSGHWLAVADAAIATLSHLPQQGTPE